MTLEDIIRQVNSDTGDEDYSDEEIVDWVNRGLDELTQIAKRQAKITIPVNSNNEYPLPDDLYEIVKVVVNKETVDYQQFHDQMELEENPASGTFDLFYTRLLTYMDADEPEGIPDLETPYHDLLVLYATYQSQYKEEEPEKQANAYQRYINRRNEYERFIRRKYNKPEPIQDVYNLM